MLYSLNIYNIYCRIKLTWDVSCLLGGWCFSTSNVATGNPHRTRHKPPHEFSQVSFSTLSRRVFFADWNWVINIHCHSFIFSPFSHQSRWVEGNKWNLSHHNPNGVPYVHIPRMRLRKLTLRRYYQILSPFHHFQLIWKHFDDSLLPSLQHLFVPRNTIRTYMLLALVWPIAIAWSYSFFTKFQPLYCFFFQPCKLHDQQWWITAFMVLMRNFRPTPIIKCITCDLRDSFHYYANCSHILIFLIV